MCFTIGAYSTSDAQIICTRTLIIRIVTTQVSHFSNAKHTILSPEGGENSVFRGKY